MLKALTYNPNVIHAKPDYFVELNGMTLIDTDYSELWGMERFSGRQAWSVTTCEANQIIAVIDSGVDFYHSVLVNNM